MNQELNDYITKSRASGASDEDIKKQLIASGWQKGDVNGALEIEQVTTSEIIAETSHDSEIQNKKSNILKRFNKLGLILVGLHIASGLILFVLAINTRGFEFVPYVVAALLPMSLILDGLRINLPTGFILLVPIINVIFYYSTGVIITRIFLRIPKENSNIKLLVATAVVVSLVAIYYLFFGPFS